MLALDPVPHFLDDLIPICAWLDWELVVMLAALSGYRIQGRFVMSVLPDALADTLGNLQGELFQGITHDVMLLCSATSTMPGATGFSSGVVWLERARKRSEPTMVTRTNIC
jgi:hypothetical protein